MTTLTTEGGDTDMLSNKQFKQLQQTKGWKPYIKEQILNPGNGKFHYLLTFEDHEDFTTTIRASKYSEYTSS